MKKVFMLVVVLLLSCVNAIAGDSFTGIWNWSEIKVSDNPDIGEGHTAEVCSGDVIIYEDGTCEMSERCVRDTNRYFPYVYTVDCDWYVPAPNQVILEMYAPDKSWHQDFLAIGNYNLTQAVIVRMTTDERSLIMAFKSGVHITENLPTTEREEEFYNGE